MSSEFKVRHNGTLYLCVRHNGFTRVIDVGDIRIICDINGDSVDSSAVHEKLTKLGL